MSRTKAVSKKSPGNRILIVDQDTVSVQLLSSLLRSRGFDVRQAATGAQAVRSVRTETPELILLAPRLKSMDTLELIQRLTRDRRTSWIPLLVVTGHADAAMERAGLKAGAVDVIRKPYREDEVLARVYSYLELGRLRRTAREAPAGSGGDWVRLAMQLGQMSAFEWNAARDGVHRPRFGAVSPEKSLPDTGENWFRRIHPDDLPRFLKVMSLLSPAYDTYDTHYRVFRTDGALMHLRESARAFFDAGGRLSRLVGIDCDVTEEEQQAEVLRHNENEMLELIGKVPIAMAVADERGGIRYVNERFTQSFGYSLEDTGQPEVWWQHAFPDDRQRDEVVGAWRASNDGTVEPYLLRCKDGSSRLVEIFGATVGDRRLIFFDDVTGRRHAEAAVFDGEERFRSVADVAPVMIWVSGADKLCTFFNKAWLNYTGRSMQEELGNGWTTQIHPEDQERCLATYTNAFEARLPFHMEYRLRRADGEYGSIVDQGVPRYTPDGYFAGYIGSAVDITDMRRNQEQMLAAQKLETLGVLASGIAHDLNNVLGCILAYADVVAVDLDGASPARENLRKIETLAMRASEIVGQIMSYAGQEELRKEPVDLSQLVKEMLSLLRISLPKGGRLRTDLPPDLPLLRANAAQLRQVVMNLILNAAESLEDQKGVITIRAWQKTISAGHTAGNGSLVEGDYVCLQVSDTGAGMSEEVRTRIFDPFFTTKRFGRGLGLAAVLGIVIDHGGAIDVTSTPGKGSTFEILLPGTEVAAAPAKAALSVPFADAGKQAILVVEKDEALRVAVSTMLRARGFPVLEARNGNLAVELIRAEHQNIGVVLLDLALPGDAGLEVYEELRRTRPGVKVILTSASSKESVAESITRMGPGTFIRKPYVLSELMKAVRNALPPESTAA